MSAAPLAKSAAERSREAYQRRKLGFDQIKIDLPLEHFAKFLIAEGWLKSSAKEDLDAIRTAASHMLVHQIYKHPSQREDYSLEGAASRGADCDSTKRGVA